MTDERKPPAHGWEIQRVTTTEVVTARLKGEFIYEDMAKVPFMEAHGFTAYREAKDNTIIFVRDSLHVWKFYSSGHIMWQTARLKQGYYQNHIPVTSLEDVIKTYFSWDTRTKELLNA